MNETSSFDFTEPGLRKKEDYKKLGNKKKNLKKKIKIKIQGQA